MSADSIGVLPRFRGVTGRRPRGYYQHRSEPSVDQLVGGARSTPDSDPDRGNPSCLGRGCVERSATPPGASMLLT